VAIEIQHGSLLEARRVNMMISARTAAIVKKITPHLNGIERENDVFK
jgi:hypothetical protein